MDTSTSAPIDEKTLSSNVSVDRVAINHRKRPPTGKYVPWEPCKAATSRHQNNLVVNGATPPSQLMAYKYDRSSTTDPIIATTDVAPSSIDNHHRSLAPSPIDYQHQSSVLPAAVDDDAPSDLMIELAHTRRLNDELKRMLVATMGDDLESHMLALSADKVRLAMHIDKYSRQLSDDASLLDAMHISNDVWRSKYLAACVLTDELVGVRTSMRRQLVESQSIIDNLLAESVNIHRQLVDIHRVLAGGDDGGSSMMMDINEVTIAIGRLVGKCHSVTGHREQLKLTANQRKAIDYCRNVDVDVIDSGDQRRRFIGGYSNGCNYSNLTISCCRKCAGKEIKLI